jgi:hypothetical protein
LIETSARFLDVAGADVDASALHGVGGTWVLDPHDVTITASNIDNGGGPNFIATQDSSIIPAGTISARLSEGTSVIVSTGADGTQPGDIRVQGLIDKDAGGAATLTLEAAHSIFVDATAQGSGAASIISESINATPGGPLNVVLRANTANSNDGTAVILLRGPVAGSLSVLSNGGDVSIGQPAVNGGTPRVEISNATIDTRTRHVTAAPDSDPVLTIGVNAPSGAITINGQAPVDVIGGVAGLGNGVDISNGSTLQTTTGPITITGDGVTSGVSVGASDITTTAGNVSLTGTSSTGIGVDMDSATLLSTAGAITVTGSGGAGGVLAQLGSMTADAGNIMVDGTALASGTVSRADGVSLFAEPISTSGSIFLRGSAASQGPMGAGVTISAAGEGTFVLTSGLPGIRVYGSGNGYEGVSTSASSGSDTGPSVFFTSPNPVAPGPIDIRGVTNGVLITGSNNDAGYHAGVRLASTARTSRWPARSPAARRQWSRTACRSWTPPSGRPRRARSHCAHRTPARGHLPFRSTLPPIWRFRAARSSSCREASLRPVSLLPRTTPRRSASACRARRVQATCSTARSGAVSRRASTTSMSARLRIRGRSLLDRRASNRHARVCPCFSI